MRVLLVLVVALVCVTQARNLEPLEFLQQMLMPLQQETVLENKVAANDASTAPSDVCDAKAVVDTGSTLIKNTVDILKESFDVFYSLAHRSNGCNLGSFRCFLKEFTETKDLLSDVKLKVTSYAGTAANLTSGIADYFQNCVGKS